ncbi:MAG: DNA-binding protein WhiA [Corallococcus sp.]|nr:DNA-binding protein WhiA [Corallococcus sp.]
MTFSQNVKSEIIKSVRNLKGCCATSFLTAVLKSIGSLSLEYKKFSFTIESDNIDFLNVCRSLAQNHLDCNGKIYGSNVNAKGAAIYSCSFDGNIGDKLKLTSRDEDNAMQLCSDSAAFIPTTECCRRSFMQGLFLSCGSVVVPVADTDIGENQLNTKYHLELRFADRLFAETVMSRYAELEFRRTERKNHTVLYLKDSEKIADYLVLINAMKGKLKLENIIIGRSMRNAANRQRNCISANIEKAVIASEKQLNAIARLKSDGVFESLPDQLKEIASAREDNPEATLDEIASMLKISKSGASHRFSKIIDLARK